MTVVVVLLAIAVGLLALLVFGLLRTHAEILRALDRAGISLEDEAAAGPAAHRSGTEAPSATGTARDIVGAVPAGGPTKVAVTGVGHFTLLAFLSSGCRTCQRFWEAFAEPDIDLPGGDTRLVIVGQAPVHDSESALAELVPPGVKAVLSSAAWEDYEVPGSPYFALVDGAEGRVVGAGSALEWDQLRNLLQQALDDAGLADRTGLSPTGSAHRPGAERRRTADEALRSAGIGPGHPSLYPDGSAPNDEHLDGGRRSGGDHPDGDHLGGGTHRSDGARRGSGRRGESRRGGGRLSGSAETAAGR